MLRLNHTIVKADRQTTYRNNLSNGWQANPERYLESKKQHSNSFQKATCVLFSFNNCTIQSQQIQGVLYTPQKAQWQPANVLNEIIANRRKKLILAPVILEV